MVGTAARLWFKQLRRLQSLRHAVLAGKQTPSACIYRVELWTAIRQSTGFYPNFHTWWSQQNHFVEGTPQELPQMVPHEAAIVLAFMRASMDTSGPLRLGTFVNAPLA